MHNLIVLKAYFVTKKTKKNSETNGRMFITCRLKINENSGVLASKNIALVDKSIRTDWEMRLFLLAMPYFCEKMFLIIARPQKQSP